MYWLSSSVSPLWLCYLSFLVWSLALDGHNIVVSLDSLVVYSSKQHGKYMAWDVCLLRHHSQSVYLLWLEHIPRQTDRSDNHHSDTLLDGVTDSPLECCSHQICTVMWQCTCSEWKGRLTPWHLMKILLYKASGRLGRMDENQLGSGLGVWMPECMKTNDWHWY